MTKQPLLLLSLVATLAACGGTPKAPKDARSENFDVTAGYLDLGGQAYVYLDVEGDVEAAAQLVNETIAVVDEIPAEYKARVDAVNIVKTLGLTDLQAVGMSSYREGNRYINKSFARTVYPRTGLMKFFGGDPHPFEILQLAPADAVIAYETDIDLQIFLNTLYAVLQDVLDEKIIADINQHLDSPIVEGSLTYRQLIGQLDTKIMGAVTLDPVQKMKLPEVDIEIPRIEAFLAVDNMGPVMDILVLKAKEVPVFSVFEDAQWQRLGVAEFLAEELLEYRPVIWRHKATQRLYIATSAAFLEERLAGKNSLAQSTVFQELSRSLPIEQGNSIMYVSPEVYNKLKGSVDAELAKEPKLTSVRKVLDLLASKVSPGQVWMSRNTKEGIYQISSSPFSHKVTLLGAIYLNQLYAASMMAVASKFLMGELSRDLFGSGEPLTPYMENPDGAPDGSKGDDGVPDEGLEKKFDEELNQQHKDSAMRPGNSGDGNAPEHMDESMKKWKQQHPGDEI